MIIIDYDPRNVIPPIHANDINKKLFISVAWIPSENFHYISYAYKIDKNTVVFRGISNVDMLHTWHDTKTSNILSSIIEERSMFLTTYYIVENRQDFQYIVDKLGLKYYPTFLGELILCANVLFGPEVP